MVPFSFAGHALCALPEGALFWPTRRALLVADLHFEKASWFAARGQMLPPYDSLATLGELTRLVDAIVRAIKTRHGLAPTDHDALDALTERVLDELDARDAGMEETRWTEG